MINVYDLQFFMHIMTVAKKKNFRSGKNISRICLETLLKLSITPPKKNSVLKKKLKRNKSRKTAGLNEIPPEWRILPFLKKSDRRITKNYRCITYCYNCGICCSPHLTGKCGTRPFLRWVRPQGRSPHAPGISKKANGPDGIPLIRGAGRWPPPQRG